MDSMGEVHAESTVRIARSVADVIAVLRDIGSQSDWWPGQYRSEPLETGHNGLVTRAAIGNDVKVAKDDFEVVYSHEPGTAGYAWVLAAPSKVQRSQTGAWSLTDVGPDVCEATLALTVDSTLPLPGFLLRKALQDTVNGATKGLRRRCEA